MHNRGRMNRLIAITLWLAASLLPLGATTLTRASLDDLIQKSAADGKRGSELSQRICDQFHEHVGQHINCAWRLFQQYCHRTVGDNGSAHFTAHKILDVLGDRRQSQIIFTRTFCQRKHKVCSVIIFDPVSGLCSLFPHLNMDDIKLAEQEENVSPEKEFQALMEKVSNINAGSQIDQQNECQRKESLMDWLKENQLQVQDCHTFLSVQNGMAVIKPPYTVHGCQSSNEIVLDRIRNIICTLPK